MTTRFQHSDVLRKVAPFAVLGYMVVALALAKPRFLEPGNLFNIGTQMAPVALMAIGQMLVIISAGIDLSVGSVLALSGIITTYLLRTPDFPLAIAVLAGLAAGTLCGWLNGVMITVGRIPPFIATLGMMGIARGAALLITGGTQIPVAHESFKLLGSGRLLYVIPAPVLVAVVFAVAGYVILHRTRLGRYTFAIGSNQEAARLSGVDVQRCLRSVYTLSGALAGLAGIILMARVNSGQPAEGTGIELTVIAACVIGGASFSGGEGTILGAMIGALIMGVLRNGCNLLQIAPFWQQVFIGLIIILAVFADQYRKHHERPAGGGTPDGRLVTVRGIVVTALVAASLFAFSRLNPELERYRFLVSPKGLTHDFWVTVHAGAQAAGGELGIDIVWNGPTMETDIAGQIAIIEDHITEGVDAMVVAACDAQALIEPLQKAVDAGIPVVTIDSDIAGDARTTFVATDNIAAAREAARTLAALIGESGKVGCIPFIPGATTSNEREQGFLDEMQRYPAIEVAHVLYSQAETAKGMQVTEDMLTATPDLKGIFAANETSAMGAASALESHGAAGRVKLVGFDAAPNELDALRRGVIQALIVQNPFMMGYLGVKTAHQILEGLEVPKRIDTGVIVVTAENLESTEVQRLLHPDVEKKP